MSVPQRHRDQEQATSTPSPQLPATTSLGGVDALASAVANALMQSFSSATQNLAVRDSDQVGGSEVSGTNSILNLRTGSTNLRRNPRQQEEQSCQPNPASSFELAAGIRKRRRVTFQPPSLFEAERRGHRRNQCGSGSTRRAAEAVPKTIQYSRNLILLPPQSKSATGEVLIPRSTKKNFLGQAGLVGKVELLSTMTDLEVRREICEVFATPMGLTSADLKSDHCELFPFSYLQNTGSGTHSYCVPSVNS